MSATPKSADLSRAAPRAKVRNRDELLGHGLVHLREQLLDIVTAGIAGADPASGTLSKVRLVGDLLHVHDLVIDLDRIERLIVIGAGKASLSIAAALEKILGDRISEGFVVVKRGESARLERIEVWPASHPLPDADSVEGARRMLRLAQSAGSHDLVILAITGGASALATLPPQGIALDEVRTLTDGLLKCGATIREVNAVRRHVCLLKGGRLVQAVQPARSVTLTLDTAPPGLPWPDMCLPDPSTARDAIGVLERYGLWEDGAASIREHLLRAVDDPELDTVKSLNGEESYIVSVGNPLSACRAAALRARECGYEPVLLSTSIEGEARELGVFLAGIAKQMAGGASPFALPGAVITGGETTVTTSGEGGRGGPNQETALAFAQRLEADAGVALAAVDSDGTDGPTDIAGGLVDSSTSARARDLGIDLEAALKAHDSSAALTRLGDAIVTGHTGTNVMNLRVLLVEGGDQQRSRAAPAGPEAGRIASIESIDALEILSGSGRPTVGVTLRASSGIEVESSVPSGTSSGVHEVFELVDGGGRYRGRGVRKAAENVRSVIAPALFGLPIDDQQRIDDTLRSLDGTQDLRHLGANAVLAVSMAAARAGAASRGVALYRYLGAPERAVLPVPIATVLAGGMHSPSPLEIEDYMLIPNGFSRFSDALLALWETRTVLEEILVSRYGPIPDVGGALAPPLADSRAALAVMLEAAERAGYGGMMQLGVDVAASAFYDRAAATYALEGRSRTRADMVGYFHALASEFPLQFIEDAFEEDDFEGFRLLTEALPDHEIVGDDLFVSNAARIEAGIRAGAANAVLLKVNQIGTVSGILAAAQAAVKGSFALTVSLRSSDTNDSFIADLAVAIGARRIKLGSPVRGERNAKYNRLLAIEHELGAEASLATWDSGVGR